MKVIKHLFLAAACMFCCTEIMAQSERSMVLHMKDSTVQKIAIASIDSISFENPKPEEKAPFKAEMINISELYSEYIITPDDTNMTYNVMCEPKAVIDAYSDDDSIFYDDRKFFQEIADFYEMELSDVMSNLLVTGEFNSFNTEHLPNTEYVMYIYGMTMQGEKTTPMLKVYFKTKPAEKISNKIAINYNFTGSTISATYKPDDNNRFFTAGLFAAADVPNVAEIQTQLQNSISYILTDYILGGETPRDYLERQCSKGTQTMRFEGSDANSLYYLVAAYLDDEAGICSDVSLELVGSGDVKSMRFSGGKRSLPMHRSALIKRTR